MPDSRNPKWLSNFVPCTVYLDGQACPSVEHAYQAAKTLNPEERARVIAASTPAQARRLGRAVTVRNDWGDVKYGIMLGLLRQKFALGTNFAGDLMAYEGKIVEYNTWHDNEWGHCGCARCQSKPHKNMLGRLLEVLRSQLQERLAEEAQRSAVQGGLK
jgi:ribA/ribD-fused uncharacterized protein